MRRVGEVDADHCFERAPASSSGSLTSYPGGVEWGSGCKATHDSLPNLAAYKENYFFILCGKSEMVFQKVKNYSGLKIIA
jgi:hypothetical protein